ncbi:PIR protein [Plasmodium ovale]|uniref:PIR protein n=1 Tax=Plasmodium ovale TaxID=36330 RepID=A0A1D3JCA2_PLAOA|nr:PIR protein [Plasmodium ovale]
MSEDIVDKTRILLKQDNTFFDNTDLYKFNGHISAVIKDDALNIYEKCKKKEAPKENDICDIDKKIEQCFGKNGESVKPAIDGSKHCDYLLYHMSDKIEECKYNFPCMNWFYEKFETLWKRSSCCEKKSSEECKKKFVKEYDMKVLKNKKELYRFLEYYVNIKSTLKEEKSKKENIFCTYVQYMLDLYYVLVEEVRKYKFTKYENDLKYFQSIFVNLDDLTTLKKECKYENLSEVLPAEEENTKLPKQVNFERFIPEKSYLSEKGEKAPEEINSILKGTPSYNLYDEFDTEVTADTNKGYCTELFKEESNYKSEAIKICKQIINNFNMLYKNNIKTKADNRCLHYKYWVYHKIWKLITDKSEYKNAEQIIKKFVTVQTEKNTPNNEEERICHYYFIFNDLIELNAKKEEKDLHDYFKYYYIIEEKISGNTREKEKYKDYLNYIYKLYIRHKIGWNCCHMSGIDPLCTHYFKCEEEYNPNDLIDMLNGTSKDNIKNKYKHIPVVHIGERKKDDPLDGENVMRIQFGRCTRIYDPNDTTKVISLRCDYRASHDHSNNFNKNLPDGRRKDTAKSTSAVISPVNMGNSSGVSGIAEEESNPTSYKIPTSVALGIGTVFTFFLYYKFTPFGSLFGKRNRERTSFEDDFNEEYIQELYYGSEYEEVNPRSRRIQIAYQRA